MKEKYNTKYDIKIEGKMHNKINKFIYLGIIVTSNVVFMNRIGEAKAVFT